MESNKAFFTKALGILGSPPFSGKASTQERGLAWLLEAFETLGGREHEKVFREAEEELWRGTDAAEAKLGCRLKRQKISSPLKR